MNYENLYKKMTDPMTGENLSYEDVTKIAREEEDRREQLAEQRRDAGKNEDSFTRKLFKQSWM